MKTSVFLCKSTTGAALNCTVCLYFVSLSIIYMDILAGVVFIVIMWMKFTGS